MCKPQLNALRCVVEEYVWVVLMFGKDFNLQTNEAQT